MNTNGSLKFYRKSKGKITSLDKEFVNIETLIGNGPLNTESNNIIDAINELEIRPVLPRVDNETIIIRCDEDKLEHPTHPVDPCEYIQAKAIRDQLLDRTVTVKNIIDLEQQANITNLRLIETEKLIGGIAGAGGPLNGNNFGKSTPTQNELTEYALQEIDIENKNSIFNGTWVINLYDNHRWVLVNTPMTEPPIFEWINTGHGEVYTATNDSLGVVKGSNQDLKINVDFNGEMLVNNLDSYIYSLQSSMSSLQSSLQFEISNLKSNLENNINNKYNNLQSSISYLSSKDNELQNNINTLENNINEYKQIVIDLEATYDTLESEIFSINSEITDLEEANSNLQTDVGLLENKIELINEDIETLETNINIELNKKLNKISIVNQVYGTNEVGAQTSYDLNSFGNVNDVRVNGVSIVKDKIADIELSNLTDFIEEIF